MNKFLFLIVMLCSLAYAGCATTIELQETQEKFGTEIRALKEQDAGIRRDTAKNDQEIADIRKRIADIAADMTEIREDMENLRGDREVLGKDESDLRAEFARKNKESADIKSQYEQLSSRIKAMEDLLEIGSDADQASKGEKVISSESKGAAGGKDEKELAYDSAYEAFKEEKYVKAREEFQDFLKKYPNTAYSDSAQFWIGESYYFERKYEQAILEYEKLIKSYPQGNKVPSALLKQGFAFLNLGDKSSAKLLFEQVTKNFPASSQARMARAKLAEIK